MKTGCCARFGALLLALTLAPLPAPAEPVLLEVGPGIEASADYQPGIPGKPAALVLHGFLQTRDYLTLQNMQSAVRELGYAVLAPTLSLGVSHRKTQLPCEAVHSHSMDDDVAEVRRWVQWLQARGHQHLVLIGHSFGGITALAYLESQARAQAPPDGVRRFIAVSLTDTDYGVDRERRDQERAQARARLAAEDRSLHPYRLSYCHAYMAPSAAYLSYADWTGKRILQAIGGVAPRVQMTAILGGKDERLPPGWSDALASAGVALRVVPGANHFFGGEHEFDLQDHLRQALGGT